MDILLAMLQFQRFIFLFLPLALCTFFSSTLAGPKLQIADGSIDLFKSEELLHIIIKADLRQLLKNNKDDDYQEGAITVSDVTYPIRLKARGNYHREDCSFPPIILGFPNAQFSNQLFDQLKNIKLVNACKLQESYMQYILREYLIYKVFNIMTEKSFRVRLLEIQYVDVNEKIDEVTRYGFVIEDQYKMAKRLDGFIINKTGIKDQLTNKEHIVMLSIFQFMMGNTDWHVSKLHHVILLRINKETESTPYVIPYDFNHSGMVNATYAIPSPIHGIEKIRDRLFLGKCYTDKELKTAIETFINNKDSIYDLYQNFKLFDKISLKSSLDYLNSFYHIIEDEEKWKHYFLNNCRSNK